MCSTIRQVRACPILVLREDLVSTVRSRGRGSNGSELMTRRSDDQELPRGTVQCRNVSKEGGNCLYRLRRARGEGNSNILTARLHVLQPGWRVIVLDSGSGRLLTFTLRRRVSCVVSPREDRMIEEFRGTFLGHEILLSLYVSFGYCKLGRTFVGNAHASGSTYSTCEYQSPIQSTAFGFDVMALVAFAAVSRGDESNGSEMRDGNIQ